MRLLQVARAEISAIARENPALMKHGMHFLYSPQESFNVRTNIIVLGHNPIPATLVYRRYQFALTSEQRSNIFHSGAHFDGVDDIDYLWMVGDLFAELTTGPSDIRRGRWRDSRERDRYGFRAGWRLLHKSIVSNISPFASYGFSDLEAISRGERHWDRLWGELLPRIRPRLVVTLGAKAFRCVERIYGVTGDREGPESGDRVCKVSRVPGGPLLIGFDHPRPWFPKVSGGRSASARGKGNVEPPDDRSAFEEDWRQRIRFTVESENLTRRFVDPQLDDLMDEAFFSQFA
jgi:hypothetical protein